MTQAPLFPPAGVQMSLGKPKADPEARIFCCSAPRCQHLADVLLPDKKYAASGLDVRLPFCLKHGGMK